MNKNISTFIACDSDYKDADIILFGAPFDGTTSYRPGARFAPNQMRIQSEGAIETYSFYQDKDMEDYNTCDIGDVEMPFGAPEKALTAIEATAGRILKDNKLPVMIGGEHLVTLGCFRACYEKYPDIRVIHFDAHADLRDDYLGEKLSHATVIRRIWDLVGDGKIHQLGIRSGSKDERDFAKAHTNLLPFNCANIDDVVGAVKAYPVYITIDLDVLDSSVFPGTGTPEAGGIDFNSLVGAIKALKPLHIVGADLNELSPPCDLTGASTAVACKALRELLLILRG